MKRPRIRILGSGNAFNTDGRASACIWIEPSEGTPFLVDAGPTAMNSFQHSGLDCGRVDRVFLTHLHGDHVAGWPFLLLHWLLRSRRVRPVDVFGPPGTERVLKGLAGLCYGETLAQPDFEVRYHELVVAEQAGLDAGQDLRFDSIPMRHDASSIGFLFHTGNSRIGVSGDTEWCPELETLAARSDVLLLDCTWLERRGAGHLSLEEIRAARARLGAATILLVHLDNAVAESVARDPLAKVVAGYDGMEFPA